MGWARRDSSGASHRADVGGAANWVYPGLRVGARDMRTLTFFWSSAPQHRTSFNRHHDTGRTQAETSYFGPEGQAVWIHLRPLKQPIF